MQKQPLGKGLSALISEDATGDGSEAFIPNLSVDKIEPNPYQPRMEIEPESLLDLADSIREHGVIEPLIVTKVKEDKYQLIAGERRWRATQLAEIETVPVVVKETSPQQVLELAIVENIQRADLNPLEEALAFQQLVEDFGLSHEDISIKVGMSRPSIANKIRLLKLPDEIKKGVLEDRVSEGHARALLGLTSKQAMVAAYKIVVRDNLSVRAVEELVRRLNAGTKKPRRRSEYIVDERTRTMERTLADALDAEVKLTRSMRGGKIVIKFKTDPDLDEIFQKIVNQPA